MDVTQRSGRGRRDRQGKEEVMGGEAWVRQAAKAVASCDRRAGRLTPTRVTGRASINQFFLTVQPATRSSPKRWPEQDARYGQFNGSFQEILTIFTIITTTATSITSQHHYSTAQSCNASPTTNVRAAPQF
ncbi:hypothetical protein E2C01_072519 [Portunus trituberculatus]|uniref:Uncharacterized protein n=1 Tax=Portunus trituberculatus TaxID=210409 RepID=A0A5B7I814_PORTR|nr:hypothetical protein [Portunus trituberculatus]